MLCVFEMEEKFILVLFLFVGRRCLIFEIGKNNLKETLEIKNKERVT